MSIHSKKLKRLAKVSGVSDFYFESADIYFALNMFLCKEITYTGGNSLDV
jgi:hypothetical protein